MRYGALAGLRIVVVCVRVIGFVGGTVLDDLTVSTDMDMRVRETRRERIERQCEPSEKELTTNHHKAMGSQVRTRRFSANYALV